MKVFLQDVESGETTEFKNIRNLRSLKFGKLDLLSFEEAEAVVSVQITDKVFFSVVSDDF